VTKANLNNNCNFRTGLCNSNNALNNINKNNSIFSENSLTVNLSDLILTNNDISLLNKGLSFIPTCKDISVFKFYDSQNKLIRNLKIKDYFSGRPSESDDQRRAKTSFTGPSSWTPPDHHVSQDTLDTIQKIVTGTESTLKKYKSSKPNSLIGSGNINNLNKAERIALNNLKRNEDIIIKPADKGGATVVMNKLAYLNEAYRQLNDSKYYLKLNAPIYKTNIVKINTVLNAMVGDSCINRKQCKYLQASESDRSRIFYLLPKIHKPTEKWPHPNMPEGRPIVSDVGSESYRVCQFIDSHLRPISIKHAAYLKDSYDFVSKIRDRTVPKQSILVTADVTALYTNMNIERTLGVARDALAAHSPHKKLNEYIMNLLEITLKNNDFEFNGDYFLQISGTAMGKCYAPALADLYMLEFDNCACHGNFSKYVELYFRFLDDVFFVWHGTLVELNDFEIYLNSIIPGIKISFSYSQDNVNFLDTTVYKKLMNSAEATLKTKIYFKSTDTHQLLHKESYHPKHTFKGIIKSQLLRYKRLSSTFEDYNSTCKILFDALTKRNYSKSFLRKMKRDVWSEIHVSRVAAKKEAFDMPIVVPYSDIGNSLSRTWKDKIKNNKKFDKHRLITAFCNTPNLRRSLVRSSLVSNVVYNPASSNNATEIISSKGMHKCLGIRCQACKYVIVGSNFKSSHNNRVFNINESLNCKSTNIVYLVTCRNCSLQYVGQTGRALADRCTDHRSAIRTKKDTPIAVHFNLPGHSLDDFSITAIEQLPFCPDALKFRLMKETTWQNLLQTFYPLGINNLKSHYLV